MLFRPRSQAPGDPKATRRGGFTLLEVLMAASVLSMALSSAIIVIQNGFRNLDTARLGTTASQMIQSEMERIRLLNWESVEALPASEEIDPASFFTTSTIETDRITVIRSVSDVPSFGGEMKEIIVTATWTTINGHPATRLFRMRYARNGLFDYYYNHAQT
ncbi:type IV pilus modification PilV family protein [Actomonas aquatica]|uniref:Prepilin-type N-terminal cleavage/methylation domain-containing protein n=1 Tax=Actomonas aquatica TaxID=2866162 RepID=A0ABZ1C545_9BACT|nr:prepilin-type N-terminal cleavage/methylation domain-containing protein [Opitutus sp. WL0086]WRQ86785.1 prepilin-type N-terminal cleavage/methylation domain-containing protein [Opitutus sp. WL0086]